MLNNIPMVQELGEEEQDLIYSVLDFLYRADSLGFHFEVLTTQSGYCVRVIEFTDHEYYTLKFRKISEFKPGDYCYLHNPSICKNVDLERIQYDDYLFYILGERQSYDYNSEPGLV